jgi:hypothetical protein
MKDDLRAMLALYDVLANSVGKPLLRGWNPKNGFKCAACSFEFQSEYPGIKKNKYIEAHNRVPVSSLKGSKLATTLGLISLSSVPTAIE